MTTTKPINLILSGLELFLNTNQSFEIMLFSRIFSCTYHKTFPPSHKQVALASRGMTIPCILHSIFHTFYNLLTKRIPLIIKSFFKMVIIAFKSPDQMHTLGVILKVATKFFSPVDVKGLNFHCCSFYEIKKSMNVRNLHLLDGSNIQSK